METIFALTTGLEKASVGLVRLSGRRAFELGRACCSLPSGKALQDRYLYRTRFRHPETHQSLDDGLICFFSAPHSYTGEDVVELHLHASRAVLKNLFDYFESQDDVRMAEPGEYTKRAFLAGKMGLLEAESVLDLVRAETNVQLLFAQKKKQGVLSSVVETWRETLLSAAAHLVATIEFPEDVPEDIPDDVPGNPSEAPKAPERQQVQNLIKSLQDSLQTDSIREKMENGVSVVLLGAPNVGKSSLINFFARQEIAITSPHPGTTRDVLRAPIPFGTHLARFHDGAGLTLSQDPVEQKGIEKILELAQNADILIDMNSLEYFPFQSQKIQSKLQKQTQIVRVVNKIDLCSKDSDSKQKALAHNIENYPCFFVSVKTGEGLAALSNFLEKWVSAFFEKHLEAREMPFFVSHRRHRTHLQQALKALQQAERTLAPELRLYEIEQAAQELSALLGPLETETVLGQLFQDFCIGK